MIINHNMNAMNAHRNMGMNTVNAGKSMEKLSSGLRINRAGDDAAGLAISEKMRSQIRGLDQASRNAQDGISMIQTAEGGLNETHSILQRMRELAVQANTATLQDTDRSKLNDEFGQLKTEADRIANTTQFNNTTLLAGGLGGSIGSIGANIGAAAGVVKIETTGAAAGTYTLGYDQASTTFTLSKGSDTQSIVLSGGAPAAGTTKSLDFTSLGLKVTLGSNFAAGTDITGTNTFAVSAGSASLLIGTNGGTNETLNVDIRDMRATGSVLNLSGSSLTNLTNASAAITSVTSAIDQVSSERSKLGAYQNRLEHTIANLNTSSENTQAAESRIRDVDMAKEMMSFSKNNILSQAAQAMLAQANQQPQGVLQLLR